MNAVSVIKLSPSIFFKNGRKLIWGKDPINEHHRYLQTHKRTHIELEHYNANNLIMPLVLIPLYNYSKECIWKLKTYEYKLCGKFLTYQTSQLYGRVKKTKGASV